MHVCLDRDSVAMGDDGMSHRRHLELDPELSLGNLLAQYPPDVCVSGGRASWLITIAAPTAPGERADRRPIGVLAKEWPAPRLFADADVTLRDLADGVVPLIVRYVYFAQVDPDIVFDRYRRGAVISADERSELSRRRSAQLAASNALAERRASSRGFFRRRSRGPSPVSYTHLTLPPSDLA